MIKLALNQFRRIYSDNGSGDRDFTKQETRLKQSQDNLKLATQALVDASNRLNDVVIINGLSKDSLH